MENRKIKELRGSSIIRSELLDGFELEKLTLSLEDLTRKKKRLSDRVRNLTNSLMGISNITFGNIKSIHKKIVALQYNLLVIKLRVATLNVGLPDRGYNGIYAAIYQSSDLKEINPTLLNLLHRIKFEPHNMEADEKIEAIKYLEEHTTLNKALIKEHRDTQLAYNKKIKIEIELYKVD